MPAASVLRLAAAHLVPVRFYLAYGSPSLAFGLSSVLRRPRLALTLTEGVVLGPHNQRRRLQEAVTARG
jgi:proline dehydrogenase